jgi:hypothetical protein
MTKVIRIVENNHVTGVVYGTVEIHDNTSAHKQNYKQMIAKTTKARIKQLRDSRTRRK